MTDLPKGARVVVAMSGGVDSSATAAMLKEQGYEVVGITLQLHGPTQDSGLEASRTCCAGKDIRDARAVADKLGIAHYVLDMEDAFHRDVMLPFAQSYRRGETPVPCVLCNQTVKFRDLVGMARDLGASALATGHYVRKAPSPRGDWLLTGADPGRDQSYFLYSTTREQLDFLLFPLGGMTNKEETRNIARAFDLPVAEKRDSQDICFVPGGDYAKVVAGLDSQAPEPGEIVDLNGTVLGRHEGIIHYTVGQRRGLGIGGGPPLYVVALRPEKNQVVAGPREALGVSTFQVHGLNWLGDDGDLTVACRIKVRSTRPAQLGTVFLDPPNNSAKVVLDEPEVGVAPGQAAVFYDGERVLGGGWIGTNAWVSAC